MKTRSTKSIPKPGRTRCAWLLTALLVLSAACHEEAANEFPADLAELPDLATTPDLVPPPDLAPEPDILELLKRIPGLTVTEKPTSLTDYRFFQLELDQPVDHERPDGARFKQRLSLLHRDRRAPVVLHTSGYNASFFSRSGRTELTSLLSANQIDFEHRYFLPSRPSPADWKYLTIKQAASDSHLIVKIFRTIYGGRFLNTGASKGGMTAVYHRRFYPADVDATAADRAVLLELVAQGLLDLGQRRVDARGVLGLDGDAREQGRAAADRTPAEQAPLGGAERHNHAVVGRAEQMTEPHRPGIEPVEQRHAEHVAEKGEPRRAGRLAVRRDCEGAGALDHDLGRDARRRILDEGRVLGQRAQIHGHRRSADNHRCDGSCPVSLSANNSRQHGNCHRTIARSESE